MKFVFKILYKKLLSYKLLKMQKIYSLILETKFKIVPSHNLREICKASSATNVYFWAKPWVSWVKITARERRTATHGLLSTTVYCPPELCGIRMSQWRPTIQEISYLGIGSSFWRLIFLQVPNCWRGGRSKKILFSHPSDSS